MDIRVEKLCKSYGDQQVFRDYGALFPEGKVSCITGSSGKGKTTLLRLLMGLEQPDSGMIHGLEGARLSAVFQEDRLCENLSPLSNLRMVCRKRVSKQELVRALERVDLTGCEEKPVRELSGGMKRRVSILRALLAEFDVLFLDEPFKGLDAETYLKVTAYVQEEIRGRTAILVSHDPRDMERLGGVEFRL